jgi:hypothetical protein
MANAQASSASLLVQAEEAWSAGDGAAAIVFDRAATSPRASST